MSDENRTGLKTLSTEVEITVRFSETDAMGVIWHGNYLKFFEDAREYFGAQYGMGYLDFYGNGYFTPIVKSEINHKAPIYYGQKALVKIRLRYSAAAKLIFDYEVVNLADGKIAAEGRTTQVFLLEKDRTLELIKPDFYSSWEARQDWVHE